MSETADDWKVAVKTVFNATRRHVIRFDETRKRNRELRERIDTVRKLYLAGIRVHASIDALLQSSTTPEAKKYFDALRWSFESGEEWEDVVNRFGLGKKMH